MTRHLAGPAAAAQARGPGSIAVDRVLIADLPEFARQAAREAGFVPITVARADAWSRNPQARPTDVALLVASRDGRCAGYLGILPGVLLWDGRRHPLQWFSTWYVAEEHRRSGVALRLLSEAVALGCDLAVTGTHPDADRIYRALGFVETGPLVYHRLRFGRGAAGRCLVRMARRLAPQRRGIAVRAVDSLSAEGEPDPPPEAACFLRGIAVINWMIRHPWIAERRLGEAEPRYAFSHTRDRFACTALEAESGASGSAARLVMSMSQDRGVAWAKVLDLAPSAACGPDVLLRLALRQAAAAGATSLDIPALLRPAIPPILRPFLETCRRLYFCRPRDPRSPLARALTQLRLDYCDGDSAFV